MKVGIVLGYGVFKETNQEYKDYLDWIAKEIGDKGLEKIVLCGGASNNLEPETTEAAALRDYLVKVLPDYKGFILEETSLTTPQNLEFAAKLIGPDDEMIVYGDLVRAAKIIWLSLHYLLKLERAEISRAIFDFAKDKKLKPFVYKNLTVLGFDFPSRDKYQAVSQSFSGLLEVEAVYDPGLDALILEQRRKDFGLDK
jgi:hypothetical protein